MNRFAIKTVEAQANSDPTVVGESGNEIELGTVQGLSQGLIMAKIKIERVKTLEKRFAKKDGVSVGLAGPQDMMARAEVLIVTAQKGADSGLVSQAIIPFTLGLILVSSFVTPILLKVAYKNEPPEDPGTPTPIDANASAPASNPVQK